ncbi:MAG TPA: acyl-CoA dehydrogenase [Spirochaetota bacterium]|nr:acyl-CoA dehydrogenase [Spirochaetota bacterium]HPR50080.1 acyl-CoA dehydrogenase [Spirochaetota bacterium]
MALNCLVDSRDARFVLFEMLEVEKLAAKDQRFADFDRATYEEFLSLAERMAVEKIYPAAAEGDRLGCTFDAASKNVLIPPCYRPALEAYHESGFIGMYDEPGIGGMGLPYEVAMGCSEFFLAASIPILMYPGLSHGAMNLIKIFGNAELKNTYIDKMMSGKWGGTMCLTEADAGSDVGALKSRAVRNSDGSFSITGQNIFISSGDNDYYENIVHLKLARIEGDPAGTKGLSIFVVPKYLPTPDGGVGEFNDVTCAGIEHKMGIKGSSTCTLSFGDNGKCKGFLLGEERHGMRIMFHMMNEERIGVGLMGLAISSSAYMHAVTYARNRIQGIHVTQLLNPEAKAVSISNHPDVKRMLLWMKSYVEGMRALSYYLAHNQTLEVILTGEEKKEAVALGEILRPILKAGNTDSSVLVASEAVQVYGGYGYCSDYPVERLMRDSKITAIYEGTNGIQAMDLAMRKILMNREQYNYSILRKRINKTITEARGIVDDQYIAPVEKGLESLDRVIEMMKKQMGEGKFLHLFMNAVPLEKAMFMIILAWMHLWAMTIAIPEMKKIIGNRSAQDREILLQENREAAFYSGRVLSGQFFIGTEFPQYSGKIDSLLAGETASIKASDPIFTGAL